MKVLIADDSATIRALLESSLVAWGFEVVVAKDGEEAWAQLQVQDAPNLAILDWEMPGLDGIEICRRLRGREAEGWPYTYVLLGTGHTEREEVIAGMEAGADDYVIKPFDQQELRVRLRAGRRIIELQAELYQMQERLRAQSRTDYLTGCLNRHGIMERLFAELSLARRGGRPMGVGVIGLDHFKKVNAEHGLAIGDLVLQELVRRVFSAIRVSDSIGRIGGEEFLLLWPGLSAEGAQIAAERVSSSVKVSPFVFGELSIPLTASLGMIITLGEEGQDAVLSRAGQALAAAKAAGRNRVMIMPL
jgi:two-component system cell cycle response regulator